MSTSNYRAADWPTNIGRTKRQRPEQATWAVASAVPQPSAPQWLLPQCARCTCCHLDADPALAGKSNCELSWPGGTDAP